MASSSLVLDDHMYQVLSALLRGQDSSAAVVAITLSLMGRKYAQSVRLQVVLWPSNDSACRCAHKAELC